LSNEKYIINVPFKGRNKFFINNQGLLFFSWISDDPTVNNEVEKVHLAVRLLAGSAQSQQAEVCFPSVPLSLSLSYIFFLSPANFTSHLAL